MGLFDKKYCDICGEKIGLLGNRKLEDGNLCKNCAKKLSPWFSERRNSTVAEIQEQLDWREANRARTAQFRATRSFGERTRLLLDETHRWFTVTRATNPADDNSDILDYSAITGCRADIDESRTELKMETRDSEGKTVRRSYNPPRYEYDYDFYLIISVNVPYFNEMKFKLNDSAVHIPYQPTGIRWTSSGFVQNRPEEPMYDPCYRGFKESCDEICALLERARTGAAAGQQTDTPAYGGGSDGIAIPPSLASAIPGLASSPAAQKAVAEVLQYKSWLCPSCKVSNSGTAVCRNCGAPLSDEQILAMLRNVAYAATLEQNAAQNPAAMQSPAAMQGPAAAQSWSCPFCGAANQGKFCESCGAQRP